MPLPKHLRAHDYTEDFKAFLERVDTEFTMRELFLRHPYEKKERINEIINSSLNRKLIIRTGNGKFRKIYED